MKISRVDTYVLRHDFNIPISGSQGYSKERYMLLTKISTDEGYIGWGEGGVAPCASVIKELLAPAVMGQDPLNINNLYFKMYTALSNAGYTGGFGGDAIASMDMALWDIAGKASGKSISTLLGGAVRTKIPVYATGLYYYDHENSLKMLLEEADSYVQRGFKAMKMKIGKVPIKEDIKRIKEVRRIIGDDVLLFVDANQAYHTAAAIDIGKRMEEYNIGWFEEPVIGTDIHSYCQVKYNQPIPIAGGELLRNRFEAKEIVGNRALSILQPDVERCGLSEIRYISAMANAFGIPVCLHSWGSTVNIAASLAISSTLMPTPYTNMMKPLENETIMEFDQSYSPIREALCDIVFDIQDGYVDIPQAPGLGIHINENTVEKFCVSHLSSV
ncbi:mandelate racemase/muconate lactonizing enzyme family protein [Massilistercora timonensis]|uniref:mandelate racemase/muconate lactonizing enzyme family protein n=1 Tax=Massilistercora timonensis TaxID=2086584 RepID=UPI003AB5E59E